MGTSVYEALFCDGAIIDDLGVPGVYALGTIPVVEDISYRHGSPSGGATHFVERPRGCLVDDLLIIFMNVGKSNETFTTPTGWTLIYQQSGNVAQNEIGMWCGYRYVTTSEPNDYLITSTGSPDSSVIMRISNPRKNTLYPFSEAVMGAPGGQSNESSPGISVGFPNSLVIRGGLANNEGWEGLTTSGVHESLFGLNTLGAQGADFLEAPFPVVLSAENGWPAGTEGVGFSFAIPNSDEQHEPEVVIDVPVLRRIQIANIPYLSLTLFDFPPDGEGDGKEPSSFTLIVPPGEFEIRRPL